MKKPKKIAVMGGGTGTFVALTGLKSYPVSLSAIVTMMDSGGSTGRLRDQLGVLPPGDLRQALVALSRAEKIWRDLFIYRFENGDLRGHNFGNIFLSALEKITGSIERAIKLAAFILDAEGEVIPVTFSQAQLCVRLADGKVIEGETHIDEPEKIEERERIVKAYLKPKVRANPRALGAIKKADLIVVGPGDLYTSIIPNFLIEGVVSAIGNSKAKKVFVMNLMTKYGQTTDYKASDHLKDLEKYLGKEILDVVVVNKEKPSEKALRWYWESKEEMVRDDLDKKNKIYKINKTNKKLKVIRRDLISEAMIKKSPSDSLRRSLIRHNSEKLAKILTSLL